MPRPPARIRSTSAASGADADFVTFSRLLVTFTPASGVLMTIIGTVRDWLKPDGHVVVEVPNVESTVQAPSHRFHYAHLYHFSGSTLAALDNDRTRLYGAELRVTVP